MIAEALRTFIELLIGQTLMADPIVQFVVMFTISATVSFFALFIGLLPFILLYKILKIRKLKKR